jgi:hypothetical protein
MKLLDHGWQYTVYDLGNGRVLKKFHSWPRAYFVILKDIFPFRTDSFFEIPGFIKGLKKVARDSFEVLKKRNIPQEWIGNPTFINQFDFTQDKVQPLHDVFEKSDTETSKKIIDQFVEFNKKLLNLGVIDKSFNITKNYGLNDKHEIVLIDIGELFDDPNKINEQRKDRAWEKHYVAGCIKDKEAQKYFIGEMDREFGIL